MTKEEREKTEQRFREALAQVFVIHDAAIECGRIISNLIIPAMEEIGMEIGEAPEISDEELEWVDKRTWDGSALPFRAEL